MMRKWVKIVIAGLMMLIFILGMVFVFSNDMPVAELAVGQMEIDTVLVQRSEILYDRDTGQCWVIERSPHGLVVETLFHSDEVDDCYKFTIKDD
jgi:hypothetical protein